MCKATDQNYHGSGKQCGHSGRLGFSLRYNAYCTLDTWHFCTQPQPLRTPVLNLGNCGLLFSPLVFADSCSHPCYLRTPVLNLCQCRLQCWTIVSVDFCTQPSSLQNPILDTRISFVCLSSSSVRHAQGTPPNSATGWTGALGWCLFLKTSFFHYGTTCFCVTLVMLILKLLWFSRSDLF